MKFSKTLAIAVLLVSAVPLAATAAPTPVRIQQVEVDQQAGTLTILGSGFNNKTDTRIDQRLYGIHKKGSSEKSSDSNSS